MKTKVQNTMHWLEKRAKRAWSYLKNPKGASSKTHWFVTVGLLLCAIIATHLLCQMVSTLDMSRPRFSSYFHFPTIFLLNLLPVALLIVFTYFLTNRAWLAFLIPTPIFVIICFVNYFKVALRGDPFRAVDIMTAGEGLGIVGQYELVFPWVFFAAIFLWIGITLLLWRYAKFRIPKKCWYIRVIAIVLCIALGAFAWCAWYTDDELYDSQNNGSLFNLWRDAENYASHGSLYAFIHSISDAIVRPPEGYSEEKAKQILSEFTDTDIPENEKVNIVVTMLESFSDLSKLEEINFTADPYEMYHELLEECYTGNLISDSIGGETINAERAFLTGFTFPQPSYNSDSNSFVRYFRSQGYQTDGSHPGHDWFYNRQNISRCLGFDRYLFMENHYQKLTNSEYALDDVLFPELARIYDTESADGQPYFTFTVSYQNHSPYENTHLQGAEYVSHEGISDEAYYLVNNYLNGVNDTIRHVANYIDSFRDNEEPVVLLFFGDHKPTFGAGNCYYEEMGVNAQDLSPEGCENLYTTPYFIWANDAAKEVLELDFSTPGRTISPAFLMAELFDVCGWEGPAWMQYQREARETIPVLHRDRIFMVDGSLTDTLTAEAKAVYKEFAIVQYYERTTLHSSKK